MLTLVLGILAFTFISFTTFLGEGRRILQLLLSTSFIAHLSAPVCIIWYAKSKLLYHGLLNTSVDFDRHSVDIKITENHKSRTNLESDKTWLPIFSSRKFTSGYEYTRSNLCDIFVCILFVLWSLSSVFFILYIYFHVDLGLNRGCRAGLIESTIYRFGEIPAFIVYAYFCCRIYKVRKSFEIRMEKYAQYCKNQCLSDLKAGLSSGTLARTRSRLLWSRIRAQTRARNLTLPKRTCSDTSKNTKDIHITQGLSSSKACISLMWRKFQRFRAVMGWYMCYTTSMSALSISALWAWNYNINVNDITRPIDRDILKIYQRGLWCYELMFLMQPIIAVWELRRRQHLD